MAVSISVAMLGASGRMGRNIIPLIAADSSGLRLSGALVAPGDNALGQDAGSFARSAPLAIAITDEPRRALAGASVAGRITSLIVFDQWSGSQVDIQSMNAFKKLALTMQTPLLLRRGIVALRAAPNL